MQGEWAQVPGPLCLAFSSAPPLRKGRVAVPGAAGQVSSVNRALPSSRGRTEARAAPFQGRLGVAALSGLQHSCGFRDLGRQKTAPLSLTKETCEGGAFFQDSLFSPGRGGPR